MPKADVPLAHCKWSIVNW